MPLKSIVDKAVEGADCVEKVFVFTATGAEVRAAGVIYPYTGFHVFVFTHVFIWM